MSRMDRYEDFDAWKLAHALNMKVWEMTSRPPVVNDFKFRDNIRDAADSAERNFPEGFGRFGPKEFARFLDHSKASLLETKNELRVGLRRGYFSDDDVRDACGLIDRSLGALTGLQRYLRSPRAAENARRIRQHDSCVVQKEPRPNSRTDELGNQRTGERTKEPTNQGTHEPIAGTSNNDPV
jgi:four helix bundle protein